MEFDFILVGNFDEILPNLPKALKSAGFSIFLIGAPSMQMIKSPWIDSLIVLSSNVQSKFLQELFTKEEMLMGLTGTFLWSSDQIMREVATSDIPLKLKLKLLPTQDENYFKMLGSKTGQFEKMSTLGIPYPESQSISSKTELANSVIKIQGKALAKGDYFGGGAQVRIFESVTKEDLALLPDDWFPILLQQFVPSERIGVEAYYRDGDLVQWLYAKISKDIYPLGPSISRTYLVPKSLDFVEHLEKIGKSANLNGFVNVSLLVDPDTGLHKFFEFDARPTIWHHIFFDFDLPFKSIWNKSIKFQPNDYLPSPLFVYEPARLFDYFLKRWNLIGAFKVVRNKKVPKYGVAISGVFYSPYYKYLNIIKLILFPFSRLTSLRAWIAKTKVKAVMLKFLAE
jgi:hypothetical protein